MNRIDKFARECTLCPHFSQLLWLYLFCSNQLHWKDFFGALTATSHYHLLKPQKGQSSSATCSLRGIPVGMLVPDSCRETPPSIVLNESALLPFTQRTWLILQLSNEERKDILKRTNFTGLKQSVALFMWHFLFKLKMERNEMFPQRAISENYLGHDLCTQWTFT